MDYHSNEWYQRRVLSELTEAQQRVVDAFRDVAASGEPPPTLRELCGRFGWASTGTARDHLRALVRKNVLRREAGARNYRLADPTEPGIPVPVLGRVAAGRPILAIENLDGETTVPASWARGGRVFALRVEGESMSGAGILDGDMIVARASRDARDGDIVVARLGDEVTVKRLRLAGRRSVLVPENDHFKPIKVDEGTSIDGIVVGLLRDFGSRRMRGGASWDR